MCDLVLRILTDLLSGLYIFAGLPCTFDRYWMAELLWYHFGPVVPF